MKDSIRKRIIERDEGMCWHCGDTEGVTIHHRINRGMGGSALLDRPSNLVIMCQIHNGLMESDFMVLREARDNGWKVSRHSSPLHAPILDYLGRWYYLGDQFEKWEINEY